jgi:hypothetical protein
VRIVEDRARLDAKIVVAFEAVKLLTIRNLRSLCMVAARAFDAIAPAQGLKVIATFGLIAEPLNQSAQIYGGCHV